MTTQLDHVQEDSTPTQGFPLKRRPRCPDYADVSTVEELLPYLDSVAKRKHVTASLHACWDLQRGERLLLRVDNWHDPLAVEAVEAILAQYGVDYEVERKDRGPVPEFEGHDEIEIFLALTKEVAQDIERWVQMDKDGTYDKVLWGFGGPVLAESNMKIARMPFITPEMIANPAHLIPEEVLNAIDEWTDLTVKKATSVRITDPEGTDLTYEMPEYFFNEDRTLWSPEQIERWWPQMPAVMKKHIPGHVSGLPPFMFDDPTKNKVNGVIASTMNHIGLYPRIEIDVHDSKIGEIRGGGLFGEKLRKLQEETKDLQYPGLPGPGLLWLWEVSIGTNPKIHRPRKDYLRGWVCPSYERMRSGIIHLGFGSVVTSAPEIEAARAGMPAGHWHGHLNFPTVTMQVDGKPVTLIDEGRLGALDDPKVREIASKYGDPDEWLEEDWIPAIPGLNCGGDYAAYAAEPNAWTKAELEICRNYHPLFMQMVGAEHRGGGSCH
ncbi:hypothetical protein [Rhodococcus sp. LB1]|uniref:hypothetical protein n=1 Tax=Rhodococcus sp. LB1 TaxID=1807499 RepID=UPI00077AC470|nr:hypothetical protein [Rhodococcus sp. LB1]KXX54210.1 hypothetical protein AZG88_25120 [Rhodococcus sp. LB1]